MKQPELGLRIAALRQEHQLTQEALAEKLGINTRSLQRIEAGETSPRANTLNKLNEVFGESFHSDASQEADLWLVVMHLSSLIPVVIVPIVIWVWKRSEDSRIDYQAIDVINFQISMWLYLMIAGFLVMSIVGLIILPLLPFVGIFICVITVKNTIRIIQGQRYHYPFSLPVLKHK